MRSRIITDTESPRLRLLGRATMAHSVCSMSVKMPGPAYAFPYLLCLPMLGRSRKDVTIL
jgi:hypothetical protein